MRISAAWDLISQMSDLDGLPEKISELQKIWKALHEPHYGYSEYTFTILLAGWLAYHRKEVSLRSYHRFCEKGVSITSQTQSLKDWANNDILQSPAFLLVTGLLKAKLIRHKKLEPALPPSPMDYDRHSSTWRRLQYFLSQMNPIR